MEKAICELCDKEITYGQQTVSIEIGVFEKVEPVVNNEDGLEYIPWFGIPDETFGVHLDCFTRALSTNDKEKLSRFIWSIK